jgi:hypothetical protein
MLDYVRTDDASRHFISCKRVLPEKGSNKCACLSLEADGAQSSVGHVSAANTRNSHARTWTTDRHN